MSQEKSHKRKSKAEQAGPGILDQRLRLVLDQMDDALLLLEEDGRLSYCNLPAADLVKQDGKSLLGQSVLGYIHPNDRESLSKIVKKLFKDSSQEPVGLRFRMKGSKEKDWIHIVARAQCGELPGQTGMVCSMFLHEDKERRRSDPFQERYNSLKQQVMEKSRKLAESEAEYQALIETMNDGVLVLNVDHRVVFANETLADLLGYTIEEMIGSSVFRFFDESSHELLSRQLERRMKGISDSYEATMVCQDKRQIICLIRGAPRFDAEGNYAGIVANITDISGRKELEERLRASEKEYRDLFHHMQNAVFQTDSEGKLLAINRAGARMLGYGRPEEIVGLYTKSFYVHTSDWERFIKELYQNGTVEDYISYFRRKDGEVVAVSSDAHVILDSSGQSKGVEGVSRDVTERVRMEKQLHDYAADLERKNDELESLVYSITHDFKSPLLVIGGLANRMERMAAQGSDARMQEYLGWIRSSVTKMEKMVNDLLGFYRADKTLVAHEEVSLGSLVDAVIRDAEPLAREKGVCLKKQGRFPVVKGYRSRLYQVFYNLVENAVKYMDQTEDGTVEVGYAPNESEHCFYVMDNGPGIPPEHHQKVFQIFYTLEPERISGTGIGLSIAKKIVEIHGGRIWLESDVGSGTTFFFTLSGVSESRLDSQDQ